MLHSLVKRQTRKLGLDQTTPPDPEVWQQFLERVSQTYIEADRERYLLERSLTISSREMQELYENLQQSSETRLAEERDKLQAVISSIGDGVCALDQEGRLLFMNPAGEQLLGWKETELAGRPLLDIVEVRGQPEQDSPTPMSSLAKIMSGGQLYRNEDGTFRRKDGRLFPISYVLNPMMKGDVLLGAVLVFRDITERKQIEIELQKHREHLEEQVAFHTTELRRTNAILQAEIIERKQAEEALGQSEQRTRQIIETALDAVITIDDKGLITGWNSQAEAIFGWSGREAIGRLLSTTIIPSQYRAVHQAGLKRFLATGEGPVLNKRIEITALRRDGREFPVELAILPMRWGECFAFSAFVRDITERKQAETALALARDQALAASRLKTELLAKVSHELRTPLGAIMGFAEMLQLGAYGALSGEQEEVAARIIENTEYLTGLVNELLDQAQLEAGRLKLKISRFSPADIVDDTISKLNVLAQAKGLTLTTDIAADVPVMLSGDPARLQQILVNLVSNAIKFTGSGEVQVRLYRPDAGHWAMQVCDTGPGIPAEAQAYIFEAFRQVDGSVTRLHTGTGLGLSIVKQLTALMGGEVILESEEGWGSIFTVQLPLHPILEPAG